MPRLKKDGTPAASLKKGARRRETDFRCACKGMTLDQLKMSMDWFGEFFNENHPGIRFIYVFNELEVITSDNLHVFKEDDAIE